MDDGQCEREGPVGSEVNLHNDLSDSHRPSRPDQNQNQGPTEEDEEMRGRGGGGGGEVTQQDALNNNREEERDEAERWRRDEGEGDDRGLVEEGEESESGSLTRGQSPDTPMTDSSFSDSGSLVELCPSVSLETTDPISPVTTLEELAQSDPEVLSDSSLTGPLSSAAGLVSCTPGSSSATEPITSAVGPSSTTEPITSTVGPSSTTEPITSTVGPSSTTEPITSTVGPSSTTEPITSTVGPSSATEPITSTVGPSSTTEPITSAVGPSSATGPITSTVGPSSTTGPTPTPALLACLQELGERGDDTHLPQYLHQIAEAFVLQEDFERAVCCVQLERLYHQRLLLNLSALQDKWESLSRTRGSTALGTEQLDRLTHICNTHQRPSTGAGQFKAADLLLKTPVCGVETPDSSLPTCSSDQLAERALGMEEVHRDSTLSQNTHPIISPRILTDISFSNDCLAGGGLKACRDLRGEAGFHGDQLHEGPLVEGGGVAGLSEGPEPTASEGSAGQHPPPDHQEVRRPEPEELRGREEEGEDGADFDQEEEEEAEEEDSSGGPRVPAEISVAEGQENEAVHQQEPRAEGDLRSEGAEFRAELGAELASLDDLAKRITVEEITPVAGLVSILKRRTVCVEDVCPSDSAGLSRHHPPAKRRVRFKMPDDGFDNDVTGGDSCLLLFLLCLVTVVMSVGGTALYCTLGDAHSSVCKDFSRNADFYLGQVQRGVDHLRHWLSPGL